MGERSKVMAGAQRTFHNDDGEESRGLTASSIFASSQPTPKKSVSASSPSSTSPTTRPLSPSPPIPPPPASQVIWTVFGLLPGYHFDEIPEHLQDNECIRSQYRAYYTWTQCWKSILGIHNESGNIWSHLIGALLFIYFMYETLYPVHAGLRLISSPSSYAVQFFYFISAIQCLLSSSIYHTFGCQQRKATYDSCAILDYSGISSLICGSFLTIIYYGLWCHPTLRTYYVGMILFVAFAGVCMPWFSFFRTVWFRPYRTLFFVTTGLVCAVPVFHTFYLVHDHVHQLTNVWYCVGEGVLYLSGAYIYANRLPERLYMRLRGRTISTAPPGALHVIKPMIEGAVASQQHLSEEVRRRRPKERHTRHKSGTSSARSASPDPFRRLRYKAGGDEIIGPHPYDDVDDSEYTSEGETLGERLLRRSHSGALMLEDFVDSLAHVENQKERRPEDLKAMLAAPNVSPRHRQRRALSTSDDDSEGKESQEGTESSLLLLEHDEQKTTKKDTANEQKGSETVARRRLTRGRRHRRSSSVPSTSSRDTSYDRPRRGEDGLIRQRLPSKHIVVEPTGLFDVWGSSHQIWHLCVLAAAICHYILVKRLWHFREEQGGCHLEHL